MEFVSTATCTFKKNYKTQISAPGIVAAAAAAVSLSLPFIPSFPVCDFKQLTPDRK